MVVFGLWFAVLFTLVRFPHERLQVPPSRMLDGWQAAAFLIGPLAVLGIDGVRPVHTLVGAVELATIPLAAGAATLLLVDSWFFTRAIWFTCEEGLVASTGRGRIRTSFCWRDVRTHRIESTLRMNEWWLTLADGRTERLFLHDGSALDPGPETDPLSTALTRGLELAYAQDARAVLARGESLALGRITASRKGIQFDGATVPWRVLVLDGRNWGRRGWNGRWKPASPHWLRSVRSIVVIDPPGGKRRAVPTRDISNFFTLKALWGRRWLGW